MSFKTFQVVFVIERLVFLFQTLARGFGNCRHFKPIVVSNPRRAHRSRFVTTGDRPDLAILSVAKIMASMSTAMLPEKKHEEAIEIIAAHVFSH